MSQLDQVSLTSDKDYLRIFQDGAITISANGVPDADSTFPVDPSAPFGFAGFSTIQHNLGSVPLYRAFYDPAKNGRWYNSAAFPGGIHVDPWLKAIATTTQLKLIMNTDGAAKTDIPVFYRIYDFANVSVSSDSRMDKIFFKSSSSGVVPASPGSITVVETVLTIPHGGGQAPLWNLQFSEDGINWYGEGNTIVGPFDTTSGPPGGPYARYFFTTAFAAADSSNLYIYLQSNYGVQKTLYVRFECDYRD